jgi:hypothetical protein
MSISTINTSADPFSSISTTLDGVEYILRFTYVQRENCYYLSIEDINAGQDLLSGIKIVTGFPLVGQYRGLGNLPPGELIALTNTQDDSPAGLGELGEKARVTLYYADETFLTTGT